MEALFCITHCCSANYCLMTSYCDDCLMTSYCACGLLGSKSAGDDGIFVAHSLGLSAAEGDAAECDDRLRSIDTRLVVAQSLCLMTRICSMDNCVFVAQSLGVMTRSCSSLSNRLFVAQSLGLMTRSDAVDDRLFVAQSLVIDPDPSPLTDPATLTNPSPLTDPSPWIDPSPCDRAPSCFEFYTRPYPCALAYLWGDPPHRLRINPLHGLRATLPDPAHHLVHFLPIHRHSFPSRL